jgi:hypothetical protein
MSGTTPDTHGDIDVDAAWDRLSAVMQRLVLREMKRNHAAAQAPPDDPPPKGKAAEAPLPTAQPLTSTTTTTAQRSDLEGDRDR